MNLNSNLYYIELASYLRDHGELNPKAFIIPFFSFYQPSLVDLLLLVNHLTVYLLSFFFEDKITLADEIPVISYYKLSIDSLFKNQNVISLMLFSWIYFCVNYYNDANYYDKWNYLQKMHDFPQKSYCCTASEACSLRSQFRRKWAFCFVDHIQKFNTSHILWDNLRKK